MVQTNLKGGNECDIGIGLVKLSLSWLQSFNLNAML